MYHLFSGQPLTIIGSTGPILVFETIMSDFCKQQGMEYLEFRWWVGFWTGIMCIIIVRVPTVIFKKFFWNFGDPNNSCHWWLFLRPVYHSLYRRVFCHADFTDFHCRWFQKNRLSRKVISSQHKMAAREYFPVWLSVRGALISGTRRKLQLDFTRSCLVSKRGSEKCHYWESALRVKYYLGQSNWIFLQLQETGQIERCRKLSQ